jgi:hypothetical protein
VENVAICKQEKEEPTGGYDNALKANVEQDEGRIKGQENEAENAATQIAQGHTKNTCDRAQRFTSELNASDEEEQCAYENVL